MRKIILKTLVMTVILLVRQSYAYTTAKTSPRKICTEGSLSRCFEKNKMSNWAFILDHGQKTEKSVLLIHGLSDSPYYMKDVAIEYFKSGFNVVAIRLAGHGTVAEDLKRVRLSDWQQDFNYGLKLAKQYGDNVLLSGFSTGGGLIYDNLSALDNRTDILGVVLFSPAMRLYDSTAEKVCRFIPNIMNFAKPFVGIKEYGVGVRYQKIAMNSVCQLYKLTRKIKRGSSKRSELPLFVSITVEDDAVNITTVLEQMNAYRGEAKVLFYVPEDQQWKWRQKIAMNYPRVAEDIEYIVHNEKIGHASILLRRPGLGGAHEQNPQFDRYVDVLRDWFNSNGIL